MQIDFLSPTKLETARLCSARLMAKYSKDGLDADYEEEQGEGAKIGTLAHAGAKFWFRRQANTPDEAFKMAMKECAENKNFKGEPDSQLPAEASGIQEARTMFDLIISYYKRDMLKVVAAERKYKGALPNGVPVNLILDLLVDRGNGVLGIIDYKTGFLSCSEEEMYDKDQPLMNLLATSLDPQLAQFSVKEFTYFWVRKGYETGPISLDYAKLSDYQEFLALEYQRILNTTNPEESINRFCKNCGRRDKCGKYNAYLAEAYGVTNPGEVQKITAEQVAMLGIDEVMARLDLVGSYKKIFEENEGILKEWLVGHLTEAKVKDFEGERYKVRLQQNKRESYQVATVLTLCQQKKIEPGNMLSTKKKEVENTFSSDPEAMAALNMTMFRGATAPFIMLSGATKRKKATKKAETPAETPAAAAPASPV